MANEIRIPIVGEDRASRPIRDVGSSADVAARQVRTLADALEAQKRAAKAAADADMSVARANALLAATEHKYAAEHQRVTDKIQKSIDKATQDSRGPFGRLLGAAGNWLKGGGGFGGVGKAIAGGTGFLGSLTAGLSALASAGPAGIAVLTGLAGAAALLVAALAPVAAALIPITIGFAGLAAIAIPELQGIMKAVQGGTKAINALPPAQRQVAREMKGLQASFSGLIKSVQPEIVVALAEALKVLKDLMPALKPLIDAAAKALDKFLANMADWLKSPSGRGFIKWLEKDGPRDIATFGRIFWDVAKSIAIALDHIYRAGVWLYGHLKRLFTVDIPAAFDLAKEYIRIFADKVQILFLSMVKGITGIMAKLPGPLGAPFRAAHKDISAQLARIQADVKDAAGNIQADWNRIHGKVVPVKWTLALPPGLPGIRSGGAPTRNFAGGTPGAAAGWAWVGERGPELVNMRGGETVIPNHALRGYADGTSGWHFTDSFHPPVGAFGRMISAFARAVTNAVVRGGDKLVTTALSTGGVTGLGRAGLRGLENLWMSAGGPGGGIAHIAAAIALAESGGNPLARNPSGASGLWQILGQVVPGNIFNPFVNALNAVTKYRDAGGFSPWVTYETGAYRQYLDQGGWLRPGWNLSYNGTGRPERVLPGGHGAAAGNTYYVTVHVGHGTHPVAAAQEIVKLLNVGARNGVRLRTSILGPG